MTLGGKPSSHYTDSEDDMSVGSEEGANQQVEPAHSTFRPIADAVARLRGVNARRSNATEAMARSKRVLLVHPQEHQAASVREEEEEEDAVQEEEEDQGNVHHPPVQRIDAVLPLIIRQFQGHEIASVKIHLMEMKTELGV